MTQLRNMPLDAARALIGGAYLPSPRELGFCDPAHRYNAVDAFIAANGKLDITGERSPHGLRREWREALTGGGGIFSHARMLGLRGFGFGGWLWICNPNAPAEPREDIYYTDKPINAGLVVKRHLAPMASWYNPPRSSLAIVALPRVADAIDLEYEVKDLRAPRVTASGRIDGLDAGIANTPADKMMMRRRLAPQGA